jgi:hypothetical protein
LRPAVNAVTLLRGAGGDVDGPVGVQSLWLACRFTTRGSRLICAGWLPQDHLFGWSVARV